MKKIPAVLLAAILSLGATGLSAAEAKQKTIAALYKEKAALAGQTVRVQGKVVKVNNNIMGRNFLHVQDGTGAKDANDLTVTSKDTAVVGDQVTVVGKVGVNRDFGSGYSYPLIIEEASVAARK
jgi:hypothetical protein